MKFENEVLKTSFTLSEPFTVGDHDKWENRRFEVMQAGARTNLTVNFLAAMAVVQDWESELIPDTVETIAKAKELSDRQIAVVAWVGTVVIAHVNSLLTVSKN